MLLVGQIIGIFGVKGWVKIFSYTENKISICKYLPCLTQQKGRYISIVITQCKLHGKTIIAKIDKIDTVQQAETYLGKKLYIRPQQLPKKQTDEYYWSELVGLTVVDLDDNLLGVVARLMETGSNDVLIITNKNKELLVPYTPNYVKQVDLAKQRLVLDWQ